MIKKNQLPIIEKEKLSLKDKYNEKLMLSLRLIKGLDIQTLSAQQKKNLLIKQNKIEYFQDLGLIYKKNNHIRLTNKGMMVSNKIISELMI